MSTTKTKTIAVRVPRQIAEAMEADAAELGTTPGGLLRTMLERRYSLPSGARKVIGIARNLNGREAPRAQINWAGDPDGDDE